MNRAGSELVPCRASNVWEEEPAVAAAAAKYNAFGWPVTLMIARAASLRPAKLMVLLHIGARLANAEARLAFAPMASGGPDFVWTPFWRLTHTAGQRLSSRRKRVGRALLAISFWKRPLSAEAAPLKRAGLRDMS